MAVSDSCTKERPNHWNYVPDASATPHTPFFVSTNNLEFVLLSEIDILILLPRCCLNLVVSGGWDRKLVGKVDHQSFRRVTIKYVWEQPPRSIIEATCITMIIIEKSHITSMKFNMAAENETLGNKIPFTMGFHISWLWGWYFPACCFPSSTLLGSSSLSSMLHPELGSGYSEPLVACMHATARMSALLVKIWVFRVAKTIKNQQVARLITTNNEHDCDNHHQQW